MKYPVVTVLKDGIKIKEYSLTSEIILGRDEGCALRLEDRAVSREHAVLRPGSDGVQIERKSSFAPLTVNGAACQSAVLKNSDFVTVGPYVIRVNLDTSASTGSPEKTDEKTEPNRTALVDVPSEPLAPPVEQKTGTLPSSGSLDLDASQVSGSNDEPAIRLDDPEGPDLGDFEPSENSFAVAEGDGKTKILPTSDIVAKLILQPGAANVEEFEIKGEDEVFIGRSKNCQIVLNDKKASRKHTSIKKSGNKFSVQDLSSVNGTFLNGIRIEQEELSGDDVIRIGDTEFNFKVVNVEFENKKADFLNIPENSSILQAPAPQAPPPQQPVPDMMAGFGGGAPGVITGMESVGQPVSLVAKFKNLPMRRKLIYVAAAAGLLFFLFDTEETVKVPDRQIASKVPVEKKVNSPTFESLSAEQKKFVEAQHALAFEYYKNKEFDKALFEIQKIFTIIPDYKDAREIERYAKEGKRKMEALEEEKRKKDQDEQLQAQINDLKQEIQRLIDEKKFLQAKELFAKLLAIDPENKSIQGWSAQIQAYEDRLQGVERQKQIQHQINEEGWRIYKSALVLKNSNRCYQAIRVLKKTKGIGINDKKLLSTVNREVSDCEDQIQNQVGPLLEEAKNLESSNDIKRAYKFYEKILGLDPNHKEARESSSRIARTLHDEAKLAYTEAVVAESYSDFETAKRKFQDCLETAPKDDIYHEKATRKLNRFISLEKTESRQPSNE